MAQSCTSRTDVSSKSRRMSSLALSWFTERNYITFCFLGHECELFVYLAFGKMLKIHRYHLDCFLYLLYSNGKGITRTTNVAMMQWSGILELSDT